jgi:hypothetical protein
MVEVRINKTTNILYVTFEGYCTVEDMQQGMVVARQEIPKLKKGFSVISDVSEFKPASPDAAEVIKEAILLAKSHGLERFVRVVGKSVVTQMQMKRLQSATGAYEAEIAGSVAEAEAMLHS